MTKKFLKNRIFHRFFLAFSLASSGQVFSSTPSAFHWTGTYRLSNRLSSHLSGAAKKSRTSGQNYEIVLKPDGKGFDITVFSASMIQVKYKAKGLLNRDGKVEAYFEKSLSPSLNPKYYQKGKHLFSLEADSKAQRRNVILSWIKDDGSRSKGFTLIRDPQK